MFGFGCGLIRSSLTLSAPARRAREGVGLVPSPMNLFSQSPYGCHFIISLAIPETGRVIAMSSLLQFYHCKSVVIIVGHVRCLVVSFLRLSPCCMVTKGQTALIGVKEGDRETVFALGLCPGQRELDHLRSDSAG